MYKKIGLVVFSLILIFSLNRTAWGFGSKANFDESTPDKTDQREYTPANAALPIDQGGYYGGHDTIMGEAMLLKKSVHERDPKDNGKFNNWVENNKVLSPLRTGAHDEDCKKWGPWYIGTEPPIGPNGDGDYMYHFYDPDSGKGLGKNDSAVKRANDYATTVKNKLDCKSFCNLSPDEKKEIIDYIGRIGHLIADMAVPEHVKLIPHPLGSPYEGYVENNWDKIVKSPGFTSKVDVTVYNNGNYSVDFNNPGTAMDKLAKDTKTYAGGPELWDFTYGANNEPEWVFNDQKLQDSIDNLVPQAILYTAGLIDSAYGKLGNCSTGTAKLDADNIVLLASLESNIFNLSRLLADAGESDGFEFGAYCPAPQIVGPGGRHPDDRFDVSDGFYWEHELKISDYDLTNLYLKTALKKGKIGVLYHKYFAEKYAEGRSKRDTATQEEKDIIQSEFDVIWEKVQQRSPYMESDWKGAPDIALFTYGYYKPSISLMLKYKEPVSFQKADFDPGIVEDHPVMLVPSGGFSGFENSEVAKASLDEYVKNGGTLVVFAQQYGKEFGLLPVPQELDGTYKPVEGYGWDEDQNCLWNGTYVDTYHQVLSAISKSTVSANVDGYFTSFPSNTSVLLRRTVNGQPAMIMYEYGLGKVIVSSMYSDWAYSHSQATGDEKNITRDMISWAKKPVDLPEIKQGEAVSVPVEIKNITDSDASSVKIQIYNPNRTTVLSEQVLEAGISAGGSSVATIEYQTSTSAALGIYHIDYILLDSQGNVIQPQTETDSGRFVVSKPASEYQPSNTFKIWATSSAEYVLKGSEVAFTIHIKNDTSNDIIGAKVGIGSHEARAEGGVWWAFRTAFEGIDIPKGEQVDIPWTFTVDKSQSIYFGLFRSDQNPNTSFMKGGLARVERWEWVRPPLAGTSIQTDKTIYKKGETVALNSSIVNKTALNTSWPASVKTIITNSRNTTVFENVNTISLAQGQTAPVNASYTLPSNLANGTYSVKSQVRYGTKLISSDSGKFELLQSRVSVAPNLPATFSAGTNDISFTLNNTGRIDVSSGAININLKDPDGADVYNGSEVFTLATGESKTVNISVNIPPLKFGNYVLSWFQSDETRTGETASISIPNTAAISLSFDKASYRIRETANLSINITNTGKFNLDSATGSGLTVNTVASDANYNNTTTIDLLPRQTNTIQCVVLLPDIVTEGGHNLGTTLTLPSGSTASENIKFNVPVSSLTITYDGPTTLNVGDKINMTIENTGGVDTTYSTVSVFLKDSTGMDIYQGTLAEEIQAGEKKTLTDILIPAQTADGYYYLNANIKNNITGIEVYYRNNIKIAGLIANLETITDKPAYLKTETITGLSNIINSPIGITGGSLTNSVTKISSQVTGQFTPFLTTGFSWPMHVAIGYDGAVYVTDHDCGCIRKFDSNGNFITKWGSKGSGDGQFNAMSGIAVGPDGFVYISDGDNNNIQKFDGNGNFITRWGSYCEIDSDYDGVPEQPCDGQFNYATGVAVGPDSAVYAVDSYNYRIEKFDSNGNFITKWGSYGNKYGQFHLPHSIAVGPDGAVYITDIERNSIEKFDGNGNFITRWGSYGSNDGQFKNIRGITVGADNSVYITDTDNYRIQKFDANGSFIAAYIGEFNILNGIAVGPNGAVYVADTWIRCIYRMASSGGGLEQLFETTIPVNQPSDESQNYTTNIGVLNATGKLYLNSVLTNNLGQKIAESEYPFYIIEGDTVLLYSTDKKAYKPGETVTITGEVKNLAAIDALGLTLTLNSENEGTGLELYNDTFDVPANGSIPFTVITTADTEGVYTLAGKVVQNSSVLVEITDLYEVANPEVTATLTVPEIAGNDNFNINLELKNEGKVDAVCQISGTSGEIPIVENQEITIPVNETVILQYSDQILAETLYSFTITGEIDQTLTKTVQYGPGATIEFTDQTPVEGGIYPEGKTGIPILITNIGLIDETIEVSYTLTETLVTVAEITKTYFIPKGESTSDILYFDLTEGSYRITASCLYPSADTRADFEVRKENIAGMSADIGQMSGGLIPVSINLTNAGCNEINGFAELSLVNSLNEIVWNSSYPVSQLPSASGTSQDIDFDINPSAVPPGNYMLEVKLFDSSMRQLTSYSMPMSIKGPVIMIGQTPAYETFTAGEEAYFAFTIINTGNQEGSFEFNFKASDFINLTRQELLAPGEQKDMEFDYILPYDLEEKDYFADYKLEVAGQQEPAVVGQVKYHVTGVNIDVIADLDKEKYNVGDTAVLTLDVASQAYDGSLNMYARVNYGDYESQEPFILDGIKTLTFDIPIDQITGEKLFYGIYHESGRSIHLNSIYIYNDEEDLSITADKQVYNPGETVNVEITGNESVSGTMVLSAPDYYETFEFTGAANLSFVLPPEMTAGTYGISAQVTTSEGETYEAEHKFDVDGIKVTVLDCNNDKAKYASSDTIMTNLVITSNTPMPATLKTWVVDPEGNYTQGEEQEINLSSSENVITTYASTLSTGTSGIHQLVYGIYSYDLLLVSGSEAFDVGDAALLGLSSDKTEYPEGNEPVNVLVSSYGTTSANLELVLDGVTVSSESVSLNGFKKMNFPLTSINPGYHKLKSVLSAGGLISEKETGFVYGNGMTDLKTEIKPKNGENDQENLVEFAATITNQGGTPSDATMVSFYDGETLIETKPVGVLNKGESEQISITWNIMGNAGEHIIKAFADPDNVVAEFNEDNNSDSINLLIPDVTLATATDKDSYKIRQIANINSKIINLTSAKNFQNLELLTTVKDPAGIEIFSSSSSISIVSPGQSAEHTQIWDTGGLQTEGIYTIAQTIKSGDQILNDSSTTVNLLTAADFTIAADSNYRKINRGENATYLIYIDPVNGWNSDITIGMDDIPIGTLVSFTPGNLVPPGESFVMTITTAATTLGAHILNLKAWGSDGTETVEHILPLTLDISGFELVADNTDLNLMQLETAQVNIDINALNGYEGTIDLTVEGVTSGMKAELDNSNMIQTPGSVILTIITSKNIKPGSYEIKVTGNDGLVNKQAIVTVNIVQNPEISGGIITSQGPGFLNEAWIRTFNKNLEPVLELMAFDTKFGANAISADIDGDGYDEIIVSQGPGPNNSATLKAFTRDGTLITQYMAFNTKSGLKLSSADVDGDWKDELIVGMGPGLLNPAIIKILKYNGSGFTDMISPKLVFNTLFGVNVAAGDVDGDGTPEIITAPGPAPFNPALIKVWKYNDGNLTQLYDFDAFENIYYGANIAVKDLDGDGIAEIIAGAGSSLTNEAIVKVFKGDGTPTGIEFNAYPSTHNGVFVGAGDVNGDGITEIITGVGPGFFNTSWVKIFGPDGTELTDFLAYPDNVRHGVKISVGNVGE